jgi:hypothetical protein
MSMRFAASLPRLLVVLGAVLAGLGACTAARCADASPATQAHGCAPPGRTIDSAFVASQALRTVAGNGGVLRVALFQGIQAHGVEVGILVSVVRSDATVGGGGLVWVDSETGCAILLRRNE